MKLNEKHTTCIALMMQGVSRQEIASRLEVHPTTIYQWQQQVEFQDALEEARRGLTESVKALIGGRLAEEAPASLDRIVRLRDGAESEKVQLTAAMNLLDRAGFRPVEKSMQVVAHALTPDFANVMANLVEELKRIPTGNTFEGELINELPERRS